MLHELSNKSSEHLTRFLTSFNDKIEYNYISCNFRMCYFDKCKIITVNTVLQLVQYSPLHSTHTLCPTLEGQGRHTWLLLFMALHTFVVTCHFLPPCSWPQKLFSKLSLLSMECGFQALQQSLALLHTHKSVYFVSPQIQFQPGQQSKSQALLYLLPETLSSLKTLSLVQLSLCQQLILDIRWSNSQHWVRITAVGCFLGLLVSTHKLLPSPLQI